MTKWKDEIRKSYTPWNKGKRGSQIAWNKGLTKETDDRVKSQGLSAKASKKHCVALTRAYAEGRRKPTNYNGSVKRYRYNSPCMGKMILQGTYEVKFARMLDELYYKGIVKEWEHNEKGFTYIGLDNGQHSYFPDFRIKLACDDITRYVDTKNPYLKSLESTKHKTKQFRDNHNPFLFVLDEQEIDCFYKTLLLAEV
jgi:hypothetical protein